jgi:hypothetical protein
MILFKIFFCFLLSLNIFAAENYIDSITITKVKKLIEKEEEIAIAYKKYILEKGTNPTSILALKTANYLPKGFTLFNPFGKQIELELDANILPLDIKDDKHEIKDFLTTNLELKSNLYDYYYSNKNRVYTKAPLGINKNNVEIVLSTKEKFIYTNKSKITTTKNDAINTTTGKYYLDTNNVLHWYQSGTYKFSFDKDLIVDESVSIFDADGVTVKASFKVMTGDVIYAGQNILHKENGTVKDYIGIDENTIIVKNSVTISSTKKGLLQFGNQSGGMIVNGDIYTWGNNENRITSIDLDDYTKNSNVEGDNSVVINTLVRAKVKMYDDDLTDSTDLTAFYTQNFFSSPLRPKFIDIFSDTMHGTCGITTKGELYCGGVTANNKAFINTFVNTNNVTNPDEMLYRSKYFDGSTDSKKAKKILALNQLWLILGQDGDIYRWGTENTYKNGFSGNETSTFNNSLVCKDVCIKWKKKTGACKKYEQQCEAADINKNPEKIGISTTRFSDITYTFSDNYKKVAALSNAGEIFIWGMDSKITKNMSCTEVSGMNLCFPTKITKDNSNLTENMTFQSIKGGLNAFIALGSDGKYYKIEQPKNSKIQVTQIAVPLDNLSVDFTADGTVVYVSATNELISTYFTSFDTIFKNTIASMSWKSIKVLEAENNSMCGLNTDNQIYCWGVQSYTDSSTEGKNTFMLPVFNTNLFDSTKDYLAAEAGSNSITTMTSGTWSNSGKFNIKYPTYIGGFNYEFIFK